MLAPSRANSPAATFPIPLADPVMSATLFANLIAMLFPSSSQKETHTFSLDAGHTCAT
jgi:hypothetical protein